MMSTSHLPHSDRRHDPRTSLQASARRWLDAEADRQGFGTVVLADNQGSVVAARASEVEPELLAALAPLPDAERNRLLEGAGEVVAVSVEIFGDEYHLCGVRQRAGGQLEAAADGLVRILAV